MKNDIEKSEKLKELYGKEYVENFSKTQSPFRIERLVKYIDLDKGAHVVDFACGNGMLLEHIAPRVASYIGVDFSEEFIKEATENQSNLKIENASFICSEINEFCNNHVQSFDIAFALDFFEHVYDEKLLEILASIRTSLRENGRLYIHTPNALFFIEQMKKNSFLLRQFPEHVAVRSPDENVKLLKEAGYTIKKILLLPHYNILRYIHFVSYLPFLGRYFKARIFIEAVK